MMHCCLGFGLVTSPTKTEDIVSNGPCTASTWRIEIRTFRSLPASRYLGLIFHESGSMSHHVTHMHFSVWPIMLYMWVAVPGCRQNSKGLLCERFFPMVRHLFDALVLPTASYVQNALEVWDPSCSPISLPDINILLMSRWPLLAALPLQEDCHMQCNALDFKELAETLWAHRRWDQVLS